MFLITVADRIPKKFFEHITGTDGLFEIRIEFESNIYRIFCCFDEGKLVTTSEPSISERNISFGPFLRYYTKPGIFFEGSAGFGFLKTSQGSDEVKWTNYSWSAGFGYSIFLNKSIALEPIINYRFLHTKLTDLGEDEKTNGLNFFIGFQIYLKTTAQKL